MLRNDRRSVMTTAGSQWMHGVRNNDPFWFGLISVVRPKPEQLDRICQDETLY
jgi:hypothetical protein